MTAEEVGTQPGEPWTVRKILSWIERYLSDRGDTNPRLAAQWLVSEALGCSRIALYADIDRPLSAEERTILREYTRRRAAGEPLQYITGSVDFRFITIKVRPGVLIPRPETEVLMSEALSELKPRIDEWRSFERESLLRRELQAQMTAAGASTTVADNALKQALEERGNSTYNSEAVIGANTNKNESEDNPLTLPSAPLPLRFVDACTGTGCIAASLAREVPSSSIIATDISAEACALAAENAADLSVSDRVDVVSCNVLDGVDPNWQGTVDLVISNPPYIPTDVLQSIDQEVTAFEPRLALDGGEDGLDVFRRLLDQAPALLVPGGVLAVELHEDCLSQARSLAAAAGFDDIRIAQDLAGRPRVLIAHKPLSTISPV